MKKVFIAAMLFIVCTVMFTGCSVYESMISTNDKADLQEFYGLSEGEAAVFVDNEQLDDPAIVQDGICYLSTKQVRSALDKRFYWDGQDDVFFFTDAEQIHEESISDSSMALVVEDQLYLSVSCLENYLDIQVTVYEEPDRIYIDTAGSQVTTVSVEKTVQVRVLGGYKSEILTEAQAGSSVSLLEQYEKWAKVRTEDGFVGYALLSRLDCDHPEESEIPSVKSEPEYTSISRDEQICLVWHDMENTSGNAQLDSLIADTEGINVISPAWFAIVDNDGSYRDLTSSEYVRKAHEAGMEVWILVDDFDDDMSIGEVLGDNSVRQNLVESLVQDTLAVNADGINVDFEYISDSCGEDFIQFLRELSIRCREEGLVLSVDNANPTYIKTCYDMEEQGRLADYVVLMGYDEHWQGSEAGSVSSLPYVENGIIAALDLVPAEKIISGLPFYARVWTEIPEEYASADAQIREDGNSEYERYSLDSVALSMDEIASLISEAGVTPEWDEDIGQYYVEIPLEYGKQRIWIEDATSLEKKLEVVSEYSVAGVAFWRIGMESESVWDVITAYLDGTSE